MSNALLFAGLNKAIGNSDAAAMGNGEALYAMKTGLLDLKGQPAVTTTLRDMFVVPGSNEDTHNPHL